MSRQPLWTLVAMREAMGADVRGGMPEAVAGLSIDSRTILNGEAYFAVKGDVHDGHAFVEAAIRNGASVAVVDQAHADHLASGLPLLVVPDVLDGLRRLARAARDSADYLVVTEKDAVKLRHRWPEDAPEPLVAVLTVTWETNGDLLTRALDRVPAGTPPTP